MVQLKSLSKKQPYFLVISLQKTESLEVIITHHRLRWAWYLAQMLDTRAPKQIHFSELASGKRLLGDPCRRFRDHLKKTSLRREIYSVNWEREDVKDPIGEGQSTKKQYPSKRPEDK